VQTASVAAAGVAALTSDLPILQAAHQSVDETLKVGLIGCGGRGRGAAINATHADSNVKITALADAFADQVTKTREVLELDIPDFMQVDDDHCFSGFDCYKQLIDTDVDVVLLCSPPYFRPWQMEYAAERRKHIFCEKPIATDAPGVRRVMAASQKCQENERSLVSGLCWRYDLGVNATMDRILKDKAIGDIRAIEANYLTAELWHRGNQPEWSQMEYQMRNWLYFNWLSGDLIAEQHIHTLDKCLWLMGDEPPVRCYGTGGRQKRTASRYGNTYDHFATVYEWANGIKAFSHCRQMSGCWSENECHVIGTQGTAHILAHRIDGPYPWRFSDRKRSMYDVEHDELFRSIREGKPINNGDYMCKATLMALMGRQASYTGQEMQWEDYWNDDNVLGPESWAWGDYAAAEVPVPGRQS
jgi:predicted dehydrogenase